MAENHVSVTVWCRLYGLLWNFSGCKKRCHAENAEEDHEIRELLVIRVVAGVDVLQTKTCDTWVIQTVIPTRTEQDVHKDDREAEEKRRSWREREGDRGVGGCLDKLKVWKTWTGRQNERRGQWSEGGLHGEVLVKACDVASESSFIAAAWLYEIERSDMPTPLVSRNIFLASGS